MFLGVPIYIYTYPFSERERKMYTYMYLGLEETIIKRVLLQDSIGFLSRSTIQVEIRPSAKEHLQTMYGLRREARPGFRVQGLRFRLLGNSNKKDDCIWGYTMRKCPYEPFHRARQLPRKRLELLPVEKVLKSPACGSVVYSDVPAFMQTPHLTRAE